MPTDFVEKRHRSSSAITYKFPLIYDDGKPASNGRSRIRPEYPCQRPVGQTPAQRCMCDWRSWEPQERGGGASDGDGGISCEEEPKSFPNCVECWSLAFRSFQALHLRHKSSRFSSRYRCAEPGPALCRWLAFRAVFAFQGCHRYPFSRTQILNVVALERVTRLGFSRRSLC